MPNQVLVAELFFKWCAKKKPGQAFSKVDQLQYRIWVTFDSMFNMQIQIDPTSIQFLNFWPTDWIRGQPNQAECCSRFLVLTQKRGWLRVGQSRDHANLPSNISNFGFYQGRTLVCKDDEGVFLRGFQGCLNRCFQACKGSWRGLSKTLGICCCFWC